VGKTLLGGTPNCRVRMIDVWKWEVLVDPPVNDEYDPVWDEAPKDEFEYITSGDDLCSYLLVFAAESGDPNQYIVDEREEWKVIYEFNNNVHLTKLNHVVGFEIPESNCLIKREKNIENKEYSRKLICDEEEITVKCVGLPRTWEKEQEVRCRGSLGNGKNKVRLLGIVKTYYTRKELRRLQVIEELNNTIPY